jgi:hypothetical protein
MMVILGSIGLSLFGLIILVYVVFKVSVIKFIKGLPLISDVLEKLEIEDIEDMHATDIDHSLILKTYYKVQKDMKVVHEHTKEFTKKCKFSFKKCKQKRA